MNTPFTDKKLNTPDFNYWLHDYLKQLPLDTDVLIKLAEDINQRHRADLTEAQQETAKEILTMVL